MQSPPSPFADPQDWEDWCRRQRAAVVASGPLSQPITRDLLIQVLGVAGIVVLLVLALFAFGRWLDAPKEDGMIHSCNRYLFDVSSAVDYRRSTASEQEVGMYWVTLLTESGAELGMCRVDVTPETYRVQEWDWADVGL